MTRIANGAPVVWMFAGQGAQYFHMGRAYYERGGAFRHWMDRLDGMAADYVGQSLVEILYDPGQSRAAAFDQILYTHPALFMVQYAMAQTLLEEGFPPPDHLLGASLGEFVAGAVAGVGAVEAMLFDVVKQARLFEAQCAGGAMLAVIDDVAAFHVDPLYAGRCELAGVNFDRCFVVSGWRTDILDLAAGLARKDVAHQVLPVPAAFHSSLIDPVEEVFIRLFSGQSRETPTIPAISCAGMPFGARAAADWWQVIRRPIAFRSTLTGFAAAHPDAVYIDLGPSGTLATFAKYGLPRPAHDRILPIMTPLDHGGENLPLVRERLRALS